MKRASPDGRRASSIDLASAFAMRRCAVAICCDVIVLAAFIFFAPVVAVALLDELLIQRVCVMCCLFAMLIRNVSPFSHNSLWGDAGALITPYS